MGKIYPPTETKLEKIALKNCGLQVCTLIHTFVSLYEKQASSA